MTTVTISLPDSLKAFVDTQVSTKGYGNVSEYFLYPTAGRAGDGGGRPA